MDPFSNWVSFDFSSLKFIFKMLVRVNSWCGSLPNDIRFAFLAYFTPNQNKSNTSMVNSNVDCIEGNSLLIAFPVYIPDVNRTSNAMNQWLQAAISQLHIPAILSAHREQRLRDLSQSTNLTGLHQLSKQVFVRDGLFLHPR